MGYDYNPETGQWDYSPADWGITPGLSTPTLTQDDTERRRVQALQDQAQAVDKFSQQFGSYINQPYTPPANAGLATASAQGSPTPAPSAQVSDTGAYAGYAVPAPQDRGLLGNAANFLVGSQGMGTTDTPQKVNGGLSLGGAAITPWQMQTVPQAPGIALQQVPGEQSVPGHQIAEQTANALPYVAAGPGSIPLKVGVAALSGLGNTFGPKVDERIQQATGLPSGIPFLSNPVTTIAGNAPFALLPHAPTGTVASAVEGNPGAVFKPENVLNDPKATIADLRRTIQAPEFGGVEPITGGKGALREQLDGLIKGRNEPTSEPASAPATPPVKIGDVFTAPDGTEGRVYGQTTINGEQAWHFRVGDQSSTISEADLQAAIRNGDLKPASAPPESSVPGGAQPPPTAPAGAGPTPAPTNWKGWQEAVAAAPDEFYRSNYLETVANAGRRVNDGDLRAILDVLDQGQTGDPARVAYAVAANPVASPETAARALALRHEIMGGEPTFDAHPLGWTPENPTPVGAGPTSFNPPSNGAPLPPEGAIHQLPETADAAQHSRVLADGGKSVPWQDVVSGAVKADDPAVAQWARDYKAWVDDQVARLPEPVPSRIAQEQYVPRSVDEVLNAKTGQWESPRNATDFAKERKGRNFSEGTSVRYQSPEDTAAAFKAWVDARAGVEAPVTPAAEPAAPVTTEQQNAVSQRVFGVNYDQLGQQGRLRVDFELSPHTPLDETPGAASHAPAYQDASANLLKQGWTQIEPDRNAFRSPGGKYFAMDEEGKLTPFSSATQALGNSQKLGPGGQSVESSPWVIQDKNGPRLTPAGVDAIIRGEKIPGWGDGSAGSGNGGSVGTGGRGRSGGQPERGPNYAAERAIHEVTAVIRQPIRFETVGPHQFRLGAGLEISHPSLIKATESAYLKALRNPDELKPILEELNARPHINGDAPVGTRWADYSPQPKAGMPKAFADQFVDTITGGEKGLIGRTQAATFGRLEVLRKTAFEQEAEKAMKLGITDPAWYKNIYSAVNHAGGVAFSGGHGPQLGGALGYSPSAFLARFANIADVFLGTGAPVPWAAGGRAIAVKALLADAGLDAAVLGISAAVGAKLGIPGQVNTTNKYGINTQLGKVVSGRTTAEASTGFLPIFRLFANVGNDIADGDIGKVPGRFAAYGRGELGPVTGIGLSLITGHDWRGQPYGIKDVGSLKQQMDLWAPFAAKNIYDAATTPGGSVPLSLWGLGAVSVSTTPGGSQSSKPLPPLPTSGTSESGSRPLPPLPRANPTVGPASGLPRSSQPQTNPLPQLPPRQASPVASPASSRPLPPLPTASPRPSSAPSRQRVPVYGAP